MYDESAPLEDLSADWLAAERRSTEQPDSELLRFHAERLSEQYERAVREASTEELRLAWEAAQRRQDAQEIGSVAWTEARRAARLLAAEYAATRPLSPVGSADD